RAQLSEWKNELRPRYIVNSAEELAAYLAAELVRYLAPSSESARPDLDTLQNAIARKTAQMEDCRKQVHDLSARLKNLVPADPIWRGRNFQRDGLLCFALLPFNEIALGVYKSAVVPAAEELGLRPNNAGEIFSNREVIEDIWDSICAARIVVVDVTGRNPNVF